MSIILSLSSKMVDKHQSFDENTFDSDISQIFMLSLTFQAKATNGGVSTTSVSDFVPNELTATQLRDST